ncbi:hypothetical protein NPIL_456921 [Nephila pilipes]|uniref:Uncharacterized protein n=1 Tax=Nephila pilipes TaxID=299642 RepID=A0A8X6TBJ5_NEPPI|nr:hypothetical protein NPIL_456921 [Nephila pilipes]
MNFKKEREMKKKCKCKNKYRKSKHGCRIVSEKIGKKTNTRERRGKEEELRQIVEFEKENYMKEEKEIDLEALCQSEIERKQMLKKEGKRKGFKAVS